MLSTLVAGGVLFGSMIAPAANNEAVAPNVETQTSTKGDTQIDLPSSAFFFTAFKTDLELAQEIILKAEQIQKERDLELLRQIELEKQIAEFESAEKARLAEVERQNKLREDQLLKEKILKEQQAKQAEEKRLAEEREIQEKKANELKVNKDSSGMTFNASYYTPYCSGCSGITAAGHNARKSIYYDGMRIVAADPRIIPLWSVIEVATPYETFKAIVLDTGGTIKNRKLDILVTDKKTAYNLGRHDVTVKIIRKGK